MAQNVARMLPAMGRRIRRPQHPFQIRTRPWELTPFFLAPVLPGETMKNLLLQCRAVTDPIKNPLLGWWAEYYIFYVRHRDMGTDAATLMNMMLDPAASVAGIADNSGTLYHQFGQGSADTTGDKLLWMRKCHDICVKTYFRDTSENTINPTADSLGLAKLTGPAGPGGASWLDSVMNAADMPAAYSADVEGADVNTTIQTNEVVDALRKWEFFRDQGLTDMSYDDYLATFGVRPHVPDEQRQIPELVRFGREWNYPTSIVNPATGTPANAVHWSTSARADKDRFFKEPGFLFGMMCFRPKVYLRPQAGSVSMWLNNAFSWLPAVLDEPMASFRQFATGKGPLPATSDVNGYWVDMKDLFLYGEQFVNFDPVATDAGLVAVPTAAMVKEYAATTDMDALFLSASPLNKIRADGLVTVSIAGRQADTSGKVSG